MPSLGVIGKQQRQLEIQIRTGVNKMPSPRLRVFVIRVEQRQLQIQIQIPHYLFYFVSFLSWAEAIYSNTIFYLTIWMDRI